MKIRYIIKDVIFQGYFSEEHGDFKGVIFASQYLDKDDAELVIKHRLTAGTYEIVKIYRK
jgi:hypothetical protein